MEPDAEMSKSAYAVFTGLSKGRITQMTKPGELLHKALTDTNRINVAVAEKLRGRNFDPGNGMAKAPRKPVGLTVAPDDEEDEDEDAALLRKSRGRIAEADADYKHMRNLERAGQLLDKAAFVGRQTDRLKALFDALRGVKRNVTDRLMSEDLVLPETQDAVRAAVGDEIEKLIVDWRKGIKDPGDA